MLYYDLIDYDETFFYEEEIVSGKPVGWPRSKWNAASTPTSCCGAAMASRPTGTATSRAPTSTCTRSTGRVERVDQNHVKYFLDLNPGEKRFVRYSVTYKRRKVGPELNQERKRERL